MSLAKDYSGIVLNQSQKPSTIDDFGTSGSFFQEFFLPENFIRGTDDNEQIIPNLSGIQVLVAIDNAFTATLAYTLQYQQSSTWYDLASGVSIGAPHEGDYVWMTIYFDQPVDVSNLLNNRFRFSITPRSSNDPIVNQTVEYDGSTVIMPDGESVPAVLLERTPYPTGINNAYGFFWMNSSGQVTYSTQHGISKIWYSNPNPLPTQAFVDTGTTPLLYNDNTAVSLAFRILALTADEGIDFLGNKFRSAILVNSSKNVSPSSQYGYWLSKPNPSKFAVESKYFDVGDQTVIDSIIVDPLTPNVFFNIYWSNDGIPGTSDSEWETKLWTPVPKTFQMTKRETIALPEPIVARYIKLEFSHLQARSYTPGDFQKPIRYKKHPKWVLDYFLANTAIQTSDLVVNTVGVIFDALDLAYNYYLDDIGQGPDQPVTLGSNQIDIVQNFLNARNDLSDQVDPVTLAKINTVMQPYQSVLGQVKSNSLLGTTVSANASTDPNYPVERINLNLLSGTTLDSVRQDQTVFDQGFPVMYFFVTARHLYRELLAPLSTDKAYFAGLREVVFLRNRYTQSHDTQLYIEPSYDLLNLERNEFKRNGEILEI